MTSTTDPGSKSPRELELELEEDRARIRRTGRELQERISIGALVDEAVNRSRERGGDWAAAVGRTICDNPIPVTVIGVCLAWMLAGGQRASDLGRRRDGRELGLDEEGLYPRPVERSGIGAPTVAPAPPPRKVAGDARPVGGLSEPEASRERAFSARDTSPGGGAVGAAAGDMRPATPPPASRPVGGAGAAAPEPRHDDESKP